MEITAPTIRIGKVISLAVTLVIYYGAIEEETKVYPLAAALSLLYLLVRLCEHFYYHRFDNCCNGQLLFKLVDKLMSFTICLMGYFSPKGEIDTWKFLIPFFFLVFSQGIEIFCYDWKKQDKYGKPYLICLKLSKFLAALCIALAILRQITRIPVIELFCVTTSAQKACTVTVQYTDLTRVPILKIFIMITGISSAVVKLYQLILHSRDTIPHYHHKNYLWIYGALNILTKGGLVCFAVFESFGNRVGKEVTIACYGFVAFWDIIFPLTNPEYIFANLLPQTARKAVTELTSVPTQE